MPRARGSWRGCRSCLAWDGGDASRSARCPPSLPLPPMKLSPRRCLSALLRPSGGASTTAARGQAHLCPTHTTPTPTFIPINRSGTSSTSDRGSVFQQGFTGSPACVGLKCSRFRPLSLHQEFPLYTVGTSVCEIESAGCGPRPPRPSRSNKKGQSTARGERPIFSPTAAKSTASTSSEHFPGNYCSRLESSGGFGRPECIKNLALSLTLLLM